MAEHPGQPTSGRTSRRYMLGALATGGSAVILAAGSGQLGIARAQEPGTPEATPQGDGDAVRIAPPDWAFVVHRIEDPYELPEGSTLVVPPGTSYLAAEVEIDNASNQPLAFAVAQIRLRASDGVEYLPGRAAGPETTLNGRVIPPGEQSRGWLWFNVPEDVELTELVFIAQNPEFSLPLNQERPARR